MLNKVSRRQQEITGQVLRIWFKADQNFKLSFVFFYFILSLYILNGFNFSRTWSA